MRAITVKASTPAELVATLPVVFGFVPQESAVLVGVEDGRVTVAGRLDLPTALEGDTAAQAFSPVLVKAVATVLVVLSDTGPVDDVLAKAAVLADSLCTTRVLVAIDGRVTDDLGDSWEPLSATIAGLPVVTTSHSDLEAIVKGPSSEDWPHMVAEYLRASAIVERNDPSWREARLRTYLGLDAAAVRDLLVDDLLQVAALVQHGPLRDVVWEDLSQDNASERLELWKRVVAVTAGGTDTVAPLGVLGITSWVSGSTALLNLAVDEMLACEDGEPSPFTHLCLMLAASGLGPDSWAEVKEKLP